MTPREIYVVGVLASLDGPQPVDKIAFWLKHPHKVHHHVGSKETGLGFNVKQLLDDMVGRGLMSRWAGPPVTYWPTQDAMNAVRDAERAERAERHQAFDAATKR